MKELSLFIDESGDFGEYTSHAPYYLITMVFHDQREDISEQLRYLRRNLENFNLPEDFYIHTGPLIRNEDIFKSYSIEERKKLLSVLFSFFRKTKTSYHYFKVDKKYVNDQLAMAASLSRQIAEFVNKNRKFFDQFDKTVIYYDNGQTEVTKIIISAFNILLKNLEYKKPTPGKHKLFQSADLACSLELINLKLENGKKLTNSEQRFFYNKKKFEKNFFKSLRRKYM